MANKDISIGPFKGLASTRNRTASDYLHDMKNFKISDDSGLVERRAGTKLFDTTNEVGYFQIFNTTISGVEIAFGIRYDDLKLYGWLPSRPQKTLPLRDISPKATFKTITGVDTNELCFRSGTRFKKVESQNSIMIWANGVSEIILIQKRGIFKIAQSLDYNKLTNITDMLNSEEDDAIYVNAIKLQYDEKLIAYFAESKWNYPFSAMNAYITAYSEIGTIGISSEIIRRAETQKLGGYISPFKIENVNTVMKGTISNKKGSLQNVKYVYKDGAGVDILDEWDSTRPDYDLDVPYLLYYVDKSYDWVDYVIPPSWENCFVLMAILEVDDGTTVTSYPEREINFFNDYPVRIRYDVLNPMTGVMETKRSGWLELIDVEESTNTNTYPNTNTVKVIMYKVGMTNLKKPTRGFVRSLTASGYLSNPGSAGELPGIGLFKGGGGIGGAIGVLELHGNAGSLSQPPASALILEDSYYFNGQSIVTIKEDRFKHHVSIYNTGLNTSTLLSSAYIDVEKQKLEMGLDSDIILDNTANQVEYFMQHGFRMALFDTVDNNQILSKRGINTKIATIVNYDVNNIPNIQVGDQAKLAPLESCLISRYNAPFISTKYSNVSSRYITAETNLPLDLRSIADIAVVPPFVFAVKDNYILRGDSNTLTLNDSIEVGNSPRFIERCGDNIIVFYTDGASAIKITNTLQVSSFMNSEKLKAKKVFSNDESIIVINAEGQVFLVGYTYSDVTDDGNVKTKYINAKNISTGIMNESPFIDVVDITYIENIYYIATKTDVYLYNVATKQWAGRYKFNSDSEILSISHLNKELLINSKGIDESLVDLFKQNGGS